MRLLKVHIHEYRCLKDVVINFEQDLTPQVFPIGGENGSGKSTLLQLIFALFHCSPDPEKHDFLRSTIECMKRPYEKWELTRYDIATIEILHQDQRMEFDFFLIPMAMNADKDNKSLLLEIELPGENGKHDYGIFCKSSHNDWQFVCDAFHFADKHIFLIGQGTQPYLFLDKSSIMELFKREGNYEKNLEEARKFLPNFYNYNPYAVVEVLEAFKKARDKDFQQILETGNYGNEYHNFVQELQNLLGDEKRISPNPQLDAITVRYKKDEKTYLDLGPEDLSHGELKRASLYSWIRHKEINNSVILIDEIENGLHPDWQYEIVRELASWGENNQYLLATHSFYLCEALTPRHVKELEPRLKGEDNADDKHLRSK